LTTISYSTLKENNKTSLTYTFLRSQVELATKYL